MIDEVIDEITDFFIDPPEGVDPAYIKELTCYFEIIYPKSKFKDVFDYKDIIEILEMLVENDFLTKTPGGLITPVYYRHKKPLLLV